MAQSLGYSLVDELFEDLEAGRWKEVAAIYERQLTREEKRSGEYRLPYAIALIRLGKISSGIKILGEDPALVATSADAIRRLALKPFVDSGEPSRALTVLNVLVDIDKPAVRDLRHRAHLLAELKRWDEAIVDARRALDIDPSEPFANSHYLQLLLQAGQVEEAGRHASGIADLAFDNPRLALFVLMALVRSGRKDAAADLAVEVAESESVNGVLADAIVRALFDAGRLDRAVETAERFLREGHDSRTIRTYLAEAHLARPSEDRFDQAISHLRRAVELDPRDYRSNAVLGEALLRNGSYEEAASCLAVACELRPKNAQTRALYARALKQCRRFPEAAAEFKRLLSLQPSSPRWQRYAAGALSQAGQRNEARKIFDTFVADRAGKLPRNFEQGLEALWDRLDEADIPQARLDWAWSLRRDESLNREEWERRAKWGHLADHYLLDWLECRDTQVHEPMRRLSDLGEAERVLGGIDISNGLVVASAHVGPMYAGPLALELLGVPTRWVASTPSVARTAYAKSLISTSDQEDMQIAQAFMRSLRQRFAVVIGVDGAINLAAPRIMFEGQEVTYSSFAARTAHRMGVPSIFAAPLWHEGKIGFMLRELPHPGSEKNPDVYADLWREAFLSALRDFLGGNPESLRLSGGIWRHIR